MCDESSVSARSWMSSTASTTRLMAAHRKISDADRIHHFYVDHKYSPESGIVSREGGVIQREHGC
jgi:hypothetical protein